MVDTLVVLSKISCSPNGWYTGSFVKDQLLPNGWYTGSFVKDQLFT